MRLPAQQSPGSGMAAGQARGQRMLFPAGRCTRGAKPACRCALRFDARATTIKREACGLVLEVLPRSMPWKQLHLLRLSQQQVELRWACGDKAHRHGNTALGQLRVIQEVRLQLRRLLAWPRLRLLARKLLRRLLLLCCRTQALQAHITKAGTRLYGIQATCRACFGPQAADLSPKLVDSSGPYPS